MLKTKCFILLIFSLLLMNCEQKVALPEPYGAIPSERQLAWHQLEYYAFIHFNMNTFTDMEWGMGNEKPENFNPSELDAEQWVKIIKNAGMKGVILTAKHHDGFCLWPSKYTEHSVKNSPWRNGKGDVVRELADACKKHNLKFGVYLSPWDRNHPEYGRAEYVTYFHNQLRELLTNYGDIFEVWFDGANGGSGYYGGANEHRTIDANTYYQWDKVESIVRELQPNAVIFGDKFDIRWVGNEEGVGGEISWCPINIGEIPDGITENEHLSQGDSHGEDWIPSEVDVSVRPGWYYHPREDHQVKSLAHLVDIYYHSVGRNSSLLLNFPVDTRGLIHEKDAEQVMKLKAIIDRDFQHKLSDKATITASSIRHKNTFFAADRAIDQSIDTYWMPEDTDTKPHLTFTFEKPQIFNRIVLQEHIALGQRIKGYQIQVQTDNSWKVVYEGVTIGYKTIIRTAPIEAIAVRLVINSSLATPLIATMELYNAPALFVPPTLSRDKNGNVTLSVPEKHLEIYYTLDGEDPTNNSLRYTNPFLVEKPTLIKAVGYDRDNNLYGEVYSQFLDGSKKYWKVVEVSSGELSKSIALIDDDPKSEFYTAQNGKKQHVTIDLGEELKLYGFTYLPPQARWAYGAITDYEFYVSKNGKQWTLASKGEFSNVKNNRTLQQIRIDSQQVRYIKLVALNQADESKAAGFSEIGIISSAFMLKAL